MEDARKDLPLISDKKSGVAQKSCPEGYPISEIKYGKDRIRSRFALKGRNVQRCFH